MSRVMASVIKIASYFVGVVGAVTIIWKVAVYVNNQNQTVGVTQSSVEEISVKLDDVVLRLDAIDIIQQDINELKKGQDELSKGQKSLVNSFGKHLSQDKSVTKDDLWEFMKEFQYEQKKSQENSF